MCLCLFPHCRYPGDGICLCHHGCGRHSCCDPGLQHGRPAAVRLWGDQEPTTSKAPFIFLLWWRSEVGVGGVRGWRGVWLWKVQTVYGCQEETGEERHQGTYWSAQHRGWTAGERCLFRVRGSFFIDWCYCALFIFFSKFIGNSLCWDVTLAAFFQNTSYLKSEPSSPSCQIRPLQCCMPLLWVLNSNLLSVPLNVPWTKEKYKKCKMSPAAMFVDGGVSRYSYKNQVSETHRKERATHVFNPPRQANISVVLVEV